MRATAPLTVAALLIASASAHAQQLGTLDRYTASATPRDDFHVDRPSVQGHLKTGVKLSLDYAKDPLEFLADTSMGSTTLHVVKHELVANLGLSLGVADRLMFFGGLPVVLMMEGDDDPQIGGVPVAITRPDDAGLGDAYLGGRLLMFQSDGERVALGLQFTGTFPTAGSGQRLRGEDFLTVHPELLLGLQARGGTRVTFNVGGRVREQSTEETSNLAFRSELTFAAGLAIPIWQGDKHPGDHLDAHAQVYGSSSFTQLFDKDETPVEAIAGLKYFHQSGFVVGGAAGPGVTKGFGSPDVRAVLSFGYLVPDPVDTDGDGLFDPEDQCPLRAEDKDQFEDQNGCPDPDNDRDGVPDDKDQCKNEPETANDWQDEDGCPDEIPDTDGDGLLDNVDQCVDKPEDKDQFEEQDGCPDPDNDQDGILDVDDDCPLEPGVAEAKGCPDPDRDGDGVVDRLDNCPDEPGPPENQGCKRKQKVRISGSALEILDKVYFRTNRSVIRRRSYSLLDNVAQVINAHPEIPLIRIEGHTDSRGRRRRNMKLSQERADAVMQYLIDKGGVDPRRLEAKGYGPDRPVVPDAKTRDDHAQNRRVEFTIPSGPDQAGPSEQADGPAPADTPAQ